MEDKWQRTQGTHGGHMADARWHKRDIHGQGLEARPERAPGGHLADTRRTHGGHKADTWRTKCGDAAKRNQAEHKADNGRRMADGQSAVNADTRGTHGGQTLGTRPEHIAASLFFLRENPTVNCLGKKIKTKKRFVY